MTCCAGRVIACFCSHLSRTRDRCSHEDHKRCHFRNKTKRANAFKGRRNNKDLGCVEDRCCCIDLLLSFAPHTFTMDALGMLMTMMMDDDSMSTNNTETASFCRPTMGGGMVRARIVILCFCLHDMLRENASLNI